MATVNRVEGPTVTPGAMQVARQTSNLDSGYADGIARGIGQAGAVIQKVYQEKQDQADMAQVLEAERKVSDYERTLFAPDNPQGITAFKGKDALGFAEKVTPDYDAIISEQLGTIRSPKAQQAFQQRMAGRRESVIGRIDTHANREFEGYVEAERKAGIANNVELAARAAVDGRPQDLELYANQGMDIIDAQPGIPEAVKVEQRRALMSSVHATALNGMLGAGKDSEASAYLQEHIAEMGVTDAGRAIALIRPSQVAEAAERNALAIASGVAPEDYGATGDSESWWGGQVVAESNNQQFGKDGKPLRSPVGATGAAQIMPATGPEAAQYAGLPWDRDRFDNDKDYNLTLGKAYKDAMLSQFGGSQHLATLAYHSGPGNVRKWIAKYGDPRKGEIGMAEFIERAPGPEGRAYVQKVASKAGQPLTAAAPVAAPSRAPLSYPEQIAAANRIADRDVRKATVATLRANHQLAEEAERETEEAMAERITAAVEAAPPGTTVDRLLKGQPDLAAYVTQKGKYDTVASMLERKGERGVRPSNPMAMQNYREVEAADPVAFVKMRAAITTDPHLSSVDRLGLLARIDAYKDPKKAGAAAALASTERQMIDSAMRVLGYDKLPKEAARQRGAEFGVAYRQAVQGWIDTVGNGKKPDGEQTRALMNSVTRQFAEGIVDGKTAQQTEAGRNALSLERFAGTLTAKTRAAVVRNLRADLGREPNEVEIMREATRLFATRPAQ